MTETLVGLVMPAWNAEAFVGEAIDSVLAQTHRIADIVVVDDGSSDRTAEIARAFGAPVRVVSQTNSGVGAARNTGVRLVRGDWIAFLDADDLLTPRAIEARLEAVREDPQLQLVFGSSRRLTDGVAGQLLRSPLPSSMLIHRDAFDRIGEFGTDTRGDAISWLLRARELGIRERTLDEQVMWRRVHGANESIRHRDDFTAFARALKSSLDRRRAS
jgi:glycosyltransferase involved in cell wall biosynthesis